MENSKLQWETVSYNEETVRDTMGNITNNKGKK